MTTSVSESITKTLGSGSGVDLKALVSSLVSAQYDTKTSQLTTKATTLTAQISGIAKLKSAITGFDTALKTLTTGGTLQTQPTSSNTAVLTAALVSGGKAPTAATTLTVQQIARAQAATSSAVASGETFKAGTLAITIGTGSNTVSQSITVAEGATLAQVAAQIKSATGMTASVVADGNGSRLTVKGATGASQAFTISATDDADTADNSNDGLSLSRLATDSSDGLTIGTTAQDAKIVIDGASYSRSSNSINNLIDGVKLNLVAASDTPVTISATPPTSALSQAVTDFVDTYNELRTIITEQTNTTDGVLKADSAATAIGRALQQLTTTKLAGTTGGVQTLADIGVATARDGTLSVNASQLASILASNPSGVEALFASGTGATGGGLSAAFSTIATRLTDKTYGLDAATTRYTKAQTDLTDEQDKLKTASDNTSTRLTQQFAAMDAKVAAYKSTQTFLTNQIAAWNKSDS